MKLDITKDEAQFIINALDVVVKQQGLTASSQALGIAVKLQMAVQQDEAPTEEQEDR